MSESASTGTPVKSSLKSSVVSRTDEYKLHQFVLKNDVKGLAQHIGEHFVAEKDIHGMIWLIFGFFFLILKHRSVEFHNLQFKSKRFLFDLWNFETVIVD